MVQLRIGEDSFLEGIEPQWGNVQRSFPKTLKKMLSVYNQKPKGRKEKL
ncbi:MAG: hypothetical protein K6E47_13090 [Lachnospiraceae bacterium]|nr:hypothetical protein [Lachnospiraceae bacterium]